MQRTIAMLAVAGLMAAGVGTFDAVRGVARDQQDLECCAARTRRRTRSGSTAWISRRWSSAARRRARDDRSRAGGAAAGGARLVSRRRPAGSPITLGGVTYAHGIGTLSINELIIDLKGQATRFLAMVGVNDNAGRQGSVTVEVWLDNKKVLISDVLRVGSPPVKVDVDLTGARFLELLIDDGNDVSTGRQCRLGGRPDLPESRARTAKPESWTFPSEPAPPIASGWPAAPRINPPRITGGTPGRPFIFRIPATGEAAADVRRAQSARQDSRSTRRPASSAGDRARRADDVEVTVTNARGKASRRLTIVGGTDALALTPPLGWNSWNVWGRSVDAAKVRAAADAMESSGLAAHGYQFVSIDDGWEGQRDKNGVLQPNEKFPDMKALTDYIHAKGLKAGIYSSPGRTTCQGLPGSLGFEEIDARTWAGWGFDLLKHDWCSYGSTMPDQPLADLQKPYIVMRQALDKVPRDVVYSLCQYGMGNVWEWGAEVGGNFWRTTGDLTDVWSNMAAVGFRQAGREKWSKPGHWTDPDMLVIGKVGWGPDIHDTRLTPNEQITHITLWTIQAAPLLIGADMAQFDRFTTDLMTNHEVLEVNQDVLGRGGSRVRQDQRLEVWVKPLADGTKAVALFNRGLQRASVTASWADLGVTGAQPVRDLWQQRDLGTFSGQFTATVPAHGAVLVTVGRPGR